MTGSEAPDLTDIGYLCRGTRDGSPYLAFVLAVRLDAEHVGEVFEAVCLPEDQEGRDEATNAICDGYALWADARDRRLMERGQGAHVVAA